MIERKSAAEIETMARAGRVVADTLALLGEAVRPGMTTQELDKVAEGYIRAQRGVPTFKGYRGFPASICTSPNSMVVHGIPGSYRIDEGDLLSVDVGVTLDGYVEQARAGNRIGDISAAIQRTTEDAGFAVVRELVGHGVGRSMHEEPQIPNFGEPGRGPVLQPGLTLALEPMITAGQAGVYTGDDRWSIYTRDDSLATHFEHTVAVTDDGPRILTAAGVRV